MIFKDRVDAGKKLASFLNDRILPDRKSYAVVSLLRGGVIVGHEVAKVLKIPHYPLPVAKIPSPTQPELAIGALCYDEIFLDQNVIGSFNYSRSLVVKQIAMARKKFTSYLKYFGIKKSHFDKVKDKITILVDDGIATGATMRAGALFLKSAGAKKIIAAAPVSPSDFSERGFDRLAVYHRDPYLKTISRFYQQFPQITNVEIKKYF